ncbi:hypothetical protein HZS_4870 [Henneguya salminicola]|nr:hypothetical protein HZS_4870 [Henneguya salminicola]
MLTYRGILVTYGGQHKRSIEASISSLLFKDIKFVGFSMNNWLSLNREKADYIKMIQDVLKLIHSGQYYRPPFACYPITDFKSAVKSFFDTRNHSLLPQRILFTKNKSFNQKYASIVRSIIK